MPIEPRVELTWERDGIAGRGDLLVGRLRAAHAGLAPSTGVGDRLRCRACSRCTITAPSSCSARRRSRTDPTAPDPRVSELRRLEYDGLAFANRLAMRGFAVLVPDVFLWGSRRFADGVVAAAERGTPTPDWLAPDPGRRSTLATSPRTTVQRAGTSTSWRSTAALLGTTLAGVVALRGPDRRRAT